MKIGEQEGKKKKGIELDSRKHLHLHENERIHRLIVTDQMVCSALCNFCRLNSQKSVDIHM